MARLARLTVAGLPHHVIHRGHNFQPVFLDAQDRQVFLDALWQACALHKVALHAFVLMDNHVHLLMTPSTLAGVPAVMQALGRVYARNFNNRHGRMGTLWEGRYRCTVLQAELYLLACMVCMDLNPVRSGLVERPADFPWSSHAHYIGLRTDTMITPPALYWGLGNTPFAREAAYKALVDVGIPGELQAILTDSALRGWALGDAAFVANTQKQTPRRIVKGLPGRPSKSENQAFAE
jgi:putative transposase